MTVVTKLENCIPYKKWSWIKKGTFEICFVFIKTFHLLSKSSYTRFG